MRSQDCSFETQRLSVADWHAQTDGDDSLVEIIRELLTPEVTEYLPASWQGPFSAERTVDWICDRDKEGIQLLVLSRETREPVALLLLYEAVTASTANARLRVGYVVSESQWGRGLASELVGGLIDWARASGVASIVGGVSAGNGASARVLQKCGFLRVEEESSDAGSTWAWANSQLSDLRQP